MGRPGRSGHPGGDGPGDTDDLGRGAGCADAGTDVPAATDAASSAAPTAAGASRIRRWTVVAWAALGWAAFTLVVLHAVSRFDPVRDPVSRYAFSADGAGLLEAALLSFALGVVAVYTALSASGHRFGRTPTLLTVATTAGLVAAALFPAAFTDDVAPASGLVHQYASLLAFLCLPGMVVCLLDRTRSAPGLAHARRTTARLLIADLAALTLFGLAYGVDTLLPRVPELSAVAGALPVGGVQRIVLVLHFCLLAGLLEFCRASGGGDRAGQEG
ncbi:DUF998 domain-containing protein [Saccharomonospora halophila]|uniref:DUF998 domain-containing protein n=1 Tax=Saccharomonospora halophila TaxID=129922 RepID=UPI000360E612|nr:DUF998 domain-containing protein [Saccharomonospora halophila]